MPASGDPEHPAALGKRESADHDRSLATAIIMPAVTPWMARAISASLSRMAKGERHFMQPDRFPAGFSL